MASPSAIPLTFRRRRPQVQSDSGSESDSSFEEVVPTKKIHALKPANSIKVVEKEIDTSSRFSSIIAPATDDLDTSRPIYSSTYNQTSKFFRPLERFHFSPTLKVPEVTARVGYLNKKESNKPLPNELPPLKAEAEVELPEPSKGCFPAFKSSKKPTLKAKEIKKPIKQKEIAIQPIKITVEKKIKKKQPVLTDYARELATQNKLYHDKVQQLLASLQTDQLPSCRIQGMLDLLDNLAMPDFYQKLRTFDHFEMLFQALVGNQDLPTPTPHMGMLTFLYFTSKDPIHTEMLLESEFTVPFLLTAMSCYAPTKLPVPSQISNLLNQGSKFNPSTSLEAYLAVLSLLQMAEAGSRRLRRLQSLITALSGLSTIVACIVKTHAEDEHISAAAIELLSSILQEEGQQMRFQIVDENPSLIPTLLGVLEGSAGDELPHAAAKLLINITNHHFEAISLVAMQLSSIMNRIVTIHASVGSLSKKAAFIMPLVALLINLAEAPELKDLSHIHPMFSELALETPEHLSLLSHLARLFECYSGVEHHSCWALAGYIGALIAFILKGTHLHSSDLPSLEQVRAEIPHGTTFIFKFLQQFKLISVQLESHHLVVHSQPKNGAASEYYALTPRTFDESLAMLLEHLSKYATSDLVS
ncbi:hypothetical protein DSO57_1001368 [Entomophthora muscae]|uniref:Uncharacterized protein n=1 Tax=Entomophthora muscae TaxID=34485 RepID=A0ACC2SY90_9FUNG|nr:hypothetical protein DSO57_1001368 [Entomophthora muscae]